MIKGIKEKSEGIDGYIRKTAPEWPIEQIAAIDRAVLRIGIFELIFDQEVPPKAVINEAVELGKTFGGENSGKFINGVLGTIYRASSRYETEDTIISAGGIVYRVEDGITYFLAVRNMHNKWTFPKGKVEEEETWQEAAKREIEEETGVKDLDIVSEVGEIKFTDKSDTSPIKKNVPFYLASPTQIDITAKNDAHTDSVAWMTEEELRQKLDYPNLINLLDKAKEMMAEGK